MTSIFRHFCVVALATFSLNAQEKPPPSVAEEKMEALKLESSDPGEYLHYRQYSPEVEEGKNYPLVIFMHGYGERGEDNTKQLKHCANDLVKYIESKEPAYLIMPQCPATMRWVRYVRPITKPPHTMDRYPTLPMQMVERLVDSKMSELPVDPNRVYIAGLSMGGFATWELLSRRPELFAAAVPICGGGDISQVENFKDVPIWAFHGDADTVVVPDYTRLLVEALKKAGATEVKYTEYPGVGHDSWSATSRNPEVWDWLFSKAK